MVQTVSIRHCACGTRLARDNSGDLCSPCAVRRSAPPELPVTFWEHPPLLQALKSRHMGEVIREYRHHPFHGQRPLTQEQVGVWMNLGGLNRS